MFHVQEILVQATLLHPNKTKPITHSRKIHGCQYLERKILLCLSSTNKGRRQVVMLVSMKYRLDCQTKSWKPQCKSCSIAKLHWVIAHNMQTVFVFMNMENKVSFLCASQPTAGLHEIRATVHLKCRCLHRPQYSWKTQKTHSWNLSHTVLTAPHATESHQAVQSHHLHPPLPLLPLHAWHLESFLRILGP